VVTRYRVGFLVATAVASVACKPNIVGRASLVDSERVLVVRSEPAEVKPDDSPPKEVTYSALYVGPRDGAPDPSLLEWAFCETQKPLAVTGPIAPACLVRGASVLGPITRGDTMKAPVPGDACEVFGPLPPKPKLGEPAGRPADPDTTGGYYQPVRLLVPRKGEPDDYAVGVTRLDCGLGGATQEQAADYTKRHRPNQNPALDSLELTHANGNRETFAHHGTDAPDAGGAVAPDAGGTVAPDAGRAVPSIAVARGETVTLRANWAACPTTGTEPAKGCTGAEPYVALDPVAHTLVDRRESMRVSWFATAGGYAHDRTGRTEEDTASFSENEWTAPDTAGQGSLWVVLRDDRGGVGFEALEINVQP
jgi:hypothetical protein